MNTVPWKTLKKWKSVFRFSPLQNDINFGIIYNVFCFFHLCFPSFLPSLLPSTSGARQTFLPQAQILIQKRFFPTWFMLFFLFRIRIQLRFIPLLVFTTCFPPPEVILSAYNWLPYFLRVGVPGHFTFNDRLPRLHCSFIDWLIDWWLT